MQKPLIIANWKTNPTTIDEAKLLFEVVEKIIPSRALDKVFRLAILKIVNPTALLRFLPNDGSFLFR
jgi:hypothetical protein